jgi:hypothetical protein
MFTLKCYLPGKPHNGLAGQLVENNYHLRRCCLAFTSLVRMPRLACNATPGLLVEMNCQVVSALAGFTVKWNHAVQRTIAQASQVWSHSSRISIMGSGDIVFCGFTMG